MSAARSLTLAAALLGLGCGRGVLGLGAQPDGAAGADGATPTSPDGDDVIAAMCAVSTTQKPPFSVGFDVHLTGTAPVYLRKACGGYDFGVSSCLSGYAKALGPLRDLYCECAAVPCSPPVGGPCEPDEAVSLVETETVVLDWYAAGVELAPNGVSGGSCTKTSLLPAGKYRVALEVYDTAEDALRGVRGWLVTRDFELPALGNTVDVPIERRAAPTCEASGTAATACTGQEPRELACNLSDTWKASWDGGELALATDTFTLAPPASFAIDRVYNTVGGPAGPNQCTTTIPRCSADARVVTTSDLVRALTEPSVAAAFASPAPTFGSRGPFGSRLAITRSDGKGLELAARCAAGEVGCERPLTPALEAIQTMFASLRQQRVAQGCPAFGF